MSRSVMSAVTVSAGSTVPQNIQMQLADNPHHAVRIALRQKILSLPLAFNAAFSEEHALGLKTSQEPTGANSPGDLWLPLSGRSTDQTSRLSAASAAEPAGDLTQNAAAYLAAVGHRVDQCPSYAARAGL